MDAALNQLISEGYNVKPEDVDHLPPLGLKHLPNVGCKLAGPSATNID